MSRIFVFTCPPSLQLEIIQHNYNLRNASNYKTIRSNTHLYYNSFLPSVVCDCNELPQDTKYATSICAFKPRLNSTMIDVHLFYRNGKHFGQIYHARLRTDSSSLNHQLYSKTIMDIPLCNCGRIETTKHYLFECNRLGNDEKKYRLM